MMSEPEEKYLKTGFALAGAEESRMFGKPCFKINGKAFISFYKDEMVFKLEGKNHEEAIHLSGSQLWDPSGKKRPMKEWVQVPFIHQEKWKKFAAAAMKYVAQG